MSADKKDVPVRGMLRLRRGAERLKRLLAEAMPSANANPELERLKVYLVQWATHQHNYRDGPKDAKGSVLADFYKSRGQTASEVLDAEGWAMSIMDSAMDDLLALPDGALMRATLRVRYLNEGIGGGGMGIRVFRNGRLAHLSMEEADRLADSGEIALIPIVKRKGLPL